MAFPLPLFPLAVVLYPGMTLPLHIFEPRYRRMVADVLQGDRRFVIVLPGDHAEAPPPGAVGCIAEIGTATTFPDGRANIVTEGRQRCTVEVSPEAALPYLVGQVDTFDDGDPDVDPVDVDRLRETARRYVAVVEAWDDNATLPNAWAEDTGTFTFQVAAVAHLDLEDKRRLLESRSPRERVRRLLDLLPRLTAQLADAVAARHQATGNGRPHPHGSLPGPA